MSQSSSLVGHKERQTPAPDPQIVLDALDSRRCRELLGLLDSGGMTVRYISDHLDIPRSTLYRYLNRLVEAGLVEESISLHHSGHHETKYAREVDQVVVSMTPDGEFTIDLF